MGGSGGERQRALPPQAELTAGARSPAGSAVAPALCLIVLIWGGTYPAVKVVQAVISPVPLATFRCAVAALVLLGLMAVAAPAWPRPTPREWATLVLLGLAGNTIFQLGMVGGLRFTTPAHSALMIALHPVFTALLAHLWLRERLTARRALGIALAFAGVVVILARGAGLAGDGTLLGDLLSLGAALAWAIYSVAGKPLLARYPSLEVTTLAMVIGAIPLLPFGLPGLVAVPWGSLGLGTWALLGYLSVVSLVVAYLLWYWALARAATARVVVFSYLTPVVAAAISVGIGQEPLTGPLVAGAVAVIAGAALAQLG